MGIVTRENIGLLNDKITVKVQKDDYLPSFEKALKEYSKKANIPGFRKGMVPSGLIKKMYGTSVFTDEVLKSVEKELSNYMVSEKLDIFGQPLPLAENDARQIDMTRPEEYSFAFEVGLKPEFSLPDLATTHSVKYKIQVTDEMVNEEIERLLLRNGKMTDPETVTGDDNVLNVTFTEVDEAGQPVEGGITKDNSLLVKYFNESTRPNWIGKKLGDSLVLTLAQAFDEKEREWVAGDLGLDKQDPAALNKHFKIEITKVGLVERPALDETFFKTVFPSKEIGNEAEFRSAIASQIAEQLDGQSRSQLQHSLYHELLNHTKIEFPESFLKRWLLTGTDKPKTQEEVEEEFPGFTDQLKWTLILDKVVNEQKIEVLPDDIRELAKQQLFGYMGGMTGIGEDQPWISEYLNKMMQDRRFVEDAVHRIRTDKVLAWAETQAHPEEKQLSREEFQKMQEEHQHHHH